MRIMATRRELIAWRPKTNAEGGVESSSQWGREKRPSSERWVAKRTPKRSAVHTKQSGGGEFE